jgi:hypothetical protein
VGRGGKAVPAPQITFWRNQALARLEQRGKAGAFGAVDDADLAQAAGEFGRRLDVVSQRNNARRQGRIAGVDGGADPAHRRRRIHRRVEIVAKGRAERLFVALFHRDVVHHRRPQILVFDRQHLGQCLGFGLQPLHAALGFG